MIKKIKKLNINFTTLGIFVIFIFALSITITQKVNAMLINKISTYDFTEQYDLNSPTITMQGLEPDSVYYRYYLNKAIEDRI